MLRLRDNHSSSGTYRPKLGDNIHLSKRIFISICTQSLLWFLGMSVLVKFFFCLVRFAWNKQLCFGMCLIISLRGVLHFSERDACATEYRYESRSLHECFWNQPWGCKIYIDITNKHWCIHYRIKKSVIRASNVFHIQNMINMYYIQNKNNDLAQ